MSRSAASAEKERERKRNAMRRWRAKHPEKSRKALRDWRAKNPLQAKAIQKRAYERQKQDPKKLRAAWRKTRGLPAPSRPESDICECCGNPPAGKALCLDHDHQTGEFRGWLCLNCNTGIGKLGDNLDGLLRATEYLRRV